MLKFARNYPVSLALWLLLAIAFVLSQIWPRLLFDGGLLSIAVLKNREMWRLATWFLFPPNFLHLVWVSGALLWWGRQLETTLGSKRYLLLCVCPSLAVGCLFLGMQGGDNVQAPLVGTHFIASGVSVAAIIRALPKVTWRSWRPWAVAALLAYYVVSAAFAPREIMIINVFSWVIAGGLFVMLWSHRRAA